MSKDSKYVGFSVLCTILLYLLIMFQSCTLKFDDVAGFNFGPNPGDADENVTIFQSFIDKFAGSKENKTNGTKKIRLQKQIS